MIFINVSCHVCHVKTTAKQEGIRKYDYNFFFVFFHVFMITGKVVIWKVQIEQKKKNKYYSSLKWPKKVPWSKSFSPSLLQQWLIGWQMKGNILYVTEDGGVKLAFSGNMKHASSWSNYRGWINFRGFQASSVVCIDFSTHDSCSTLVLFPLNLHYRFVNW